MSTPADEPLISRPDPDRASLFSSSYASSDSGADQWRRTTRVVRLISFIMANLCALSGGSLVVFSLYAPLFQSHLRYTQFQVNAVAIAGSISLYLPISILGYICDRVGITPLALLATLLFGTGYGTAAVVYRKLDLQYNNPGGLDVDGNWSLPWMMFAFVCIGTATCSIYMASVSSCAKNFGKGKYRGLALATPIASFGLSPMWISMLGGSRIFSEIKSDGTTGDLDVFRFFVFLAIMHCSMGILGTLTLRVINEQDLIEEAIEELEHSGLLDGSSLLSRSLSRSMSYGTVGAASEGGESLLDATKDEDAQWKKNWVLNAETRRFLVDRTMWPFAFGFLFMVGPGEAFINNLGSILRTLTPPESQGVGHHSSAATHVSIFGVTSTIARLLIGSLTDLLAPSPQTQHPQVAPYRSTSNRFSISRVAFLLFFASLLSVGLVILASGVVQNHEERFWLVSGLIGAGYGAIFSLTPLIVTIIWGVENFSTNFGIVCMLPALGSTFWGLVYSAVYQQGAQSGSSEESSLFCYGAKCYSSTFWGEAVTVWIGCGLLLWAWKGKGGWMQRGIVI